MLAHHDSHDVGEISMPRVQSSMSEVLSLVRSTVTVQVVSVEDNVKLIVELLLVVAESTPVHCASCGLMVKETT